MLRCSSWPDPPLYRNCLRTSFCQRCCRRGPSNCGSNLGCLSVGVCLDGPCSTISSSTPLVPRAYSGPPTAPLPLSPNPTSLPLIPPPIQARATPRLTHLPPWPTYQAHNPPSPQPFPLLLHHLSLPLFTTPSPSPLLHSRGIFPVEAESEQKWLRTHKGIETVLGVSYKGFELCYTICCEISKLDIKFERIPSCLLGRPQARDLKVCGSLKGLFLQLIMILGFLECQGFSNF